MLLGRDIRHVPRQDGDAVVRQIVEAGQRDLLLVARFDWKRVSPDVASRLHVVLETPSWVVSEVQGPPGAATVAPR